MRISRHDWPALLLVLFCVDIAAQVPQAKTLEPRSAKAGTVVKITGVGLDQTKIDDAYLTDHRFDLKVKVLEQTSTSLTIRIPPFIKPGRHQLLLQTVGERPSLLEQPVYLVVEVDDAQVAATPVKEKELTAHDLPARDLTPKTLPVSQPVEKAQPARPTVAAIAVPGGAQVPQVRTLEPRNAKPGTVVTVTGVALEKARVDDAFLTDHRFDLKVKVLEQTSTSITFRIPPFVKPGRHQLLLQTAGEKPMLLEQPVFLVVDVDDVQVAAKEPGVKDKTGVEKDATNSERQP